MPPKSSVWGHSLRKMKPDKEKMLIDNFFRKAVAEYHFSVGSIFFQRTLDTLSNEDIVKESKNYFIELLDITPNEIALSNLSREQFDLCLNELLNNNDLFISGKSGIVLNASMQISKWLINYKEVSTESTLSVSYGAKPWISTFFTFSSMDEFDYIKGVLEELGICRLNEKYLKEKKQKKS